MKLKYIKSTDLPKLFYGTLLGLVSLWLYVIISGNYFHIVINNEKLLELSSIIDKNFILNNCVRLFLYYSTTVIITYGVLQKRLFSYKPILISSIMFVTWLLKTILLNYQIAQYIDFLYFIALGIILKKKWYRTIIGCVLSLFFNVVSNFIKSYFILYVDINNLPIIIYLALSIDIYLMYIIYYAFEMCRKEVTHEQRVSILQITKEMENYFCNLGKFISSIFRRNRISSNEIKDKLYNIYCGITFFCLVYFSLLIVGILWNRIIEITLSVIYFHIFRGKEKDTFHCETDIKCWCFSIFNFLLIQKLTLPIHLSYITTILLSFILCVCMRILYKIKQKKVMTYRQRILAIVPNSESKIDKLCKSFAISELAETIYLYLNNTIEETSDILQIDTSTINRRIKKFLKTVE